MRAWIFPVFSLLLAGLVIFFHVTNPVEGGEVTNPMLWASDDWTEWMQMTPEAAMSRLPHGAEVPATEWIRAFFDEAGHGLWHAENAWSSLPEGWSQRAWRGGWLSGSEASMSLWEERPGEMAARWREGEAGTALRRTDFGWQLQGEGVLFWPDLKMGCGNDDSTVRPTLHAPRGAGVPSDWWSGRLGEAPTDYAPFDLTLCEAGIRMSSWGTRWEGGGRWHVEAQWREDLQSLATARGWSISWEGDDVIVNGAPDWTWEVLEDERTGQTPWSFWTGSAMENGVVVWVPQRQDGTDEVRSSSNPVAVDIRTAKDGVAGRVRNHRTASEMTLSLEAETLVAAQDNGAAVWSMTLASSLLEGGAVEVDVYANGKYQAMFCEPSALHMVDVKGREVSGFPIRPAKGEWTAWALVDYENTRKYRYLVASGASGLVENFRGEGERTTGWKHRPGDGVDVSSPIRHIRHLRLGSKDYLYVGRENGQVELLKRNGSTRATTPVRVDPQHAPLFRKGANLDRTSVLYFDETGWVREFTLGQGEEVGLSGLTRADRIEQRDVDNDGRDEVITWLRGERSVWNARNERVN